MWRTASGGRSAPNFLVAVALITIVPALPGCGPLVADEMGQGVQSPRAKADSDDDDRLSATAVIDDHKHLELVPDTPAQSIAKVLLLGGSDSIVPLQVQLMKTLPDVTYFVVPSGRNQVTEQSYLDAMTAAGVSPTDLDVRYVKDFTKPLTDWTQDRLMRFRHAVDDRAVVMPVRSDAVGMNEYAAFELGVPRYLEAQYADEFARFEHDQYLAEHVVDSATGELYSYSSSYASWYRASSWKLTHGDGGDRVTTESTMFVGAPAYAKMLSTIEARVRLDGTVGSYEQLLAELFKKQRVIPVGDADPTVHYLFHLDMFLSAFDSNDGKTTVILGSPLLMLNELFGLDVDQVDDLDDELDRLPDWCLKDAFSWKRRVSSYQRLRADLKGRSYLRVVEIPILFLDLSVNQIANKPILTFNNGLMTHRDGKPTFISVSYHFDRPEIDAMIAKAKAKVVSTLEGVGLETVFVTGGENSVKNAGELRCTAGVIELGPPSSSPAPEPAPGPPAEPEELFFEDFESYRYWSHTGLWHRSLNGSCTDPAQASGKVAWYFGDRDTCSYQTDPRERVEGTLTSPQIEGGSATGELTFSFYRKVEKSSSSGTKAYDVTTVQVAEAGSDDWQVVWSRDSRDVSEEQWTASEPIALSSFAGKTIRVRFTFDSIDAYLNNYTGWLIDDVRVTR